MKMKVVKKEKELIELEVLDVDDTLIYPLIGELLSDSKVVEATYRKGHPEIDMPKIFVRVNEGRPQTALKRAAKSLANQFEECKKLFEDLLKERKIDKEG